jgi:hypothetical protein
MGKFITLVSLTWRQVYEEQLKLKGENKIKMREKRDST